MRYKKIISLNIVKDMLNQTFPVIYRDTCFMVDPSFLSNSSRKFKELIKNFLDSGYDIQSLRLIIAYDQFLERNVDNFLKVCQGLQTDVNNSEVEELCEIAKMFQADEIYNKGITFIQNSIDPNFFIPYNKYCEKQYLFIESNETNLIHHVNLNELEFDENSDCNETEDNKRINNNRASKNIRNSIRQKYQSVIYQLQVEKPFMKCRRFQLVKDGQTILSAKQKDNEIFICSGNDVHINEEKFRNDARITQNRQYFNIITTDEQTFKITYIPKGFDKQFSMKLTFVYKQSQLTWTTKYPKVPTTIYGELNHIPINSNKNIVLQNPAGQVTFIVRKMKKREFEAECNPSLSPIIAFSIALSQIVGPYSP